jgi:hypothetical protein
LSGLCHPHCCCKNPFTHVLMLSAVFSHFFASSPSSGAEISTEIFVAIVAKQFALCSRVGILVLPSHSRLMLLTQSFKCCSILLGEDENKVIAREEVKRQLSRSALGYNVTDFLLVLVVDILLVKQSGYGGDIRWLVNPPRASGRA